MIFLIWDYQSPSRTVPYLQDTGIIHKDGIKYSELALRVGKSSLKFNGKFSIKSDLFSLQLMPLKKIGAILNKRSLSNRQRVLSDREILKLFT